MGRNTTQLTRLPDPPNNAPNFTAYFSARRISPGGRTLSMFPIVYAKSRPTSRLPISPISRCGPMTFHYVSDVMGGARRLFRMLPGSVRRTEYRRKELTHGPTGQPRWEFPTTWLMDHPTGYGPSISPANGRKDPQIDVEGGSTRSRVNFEGVRGRSDFPPPQISLPRMRCTRPGCPYSLMRLRTRGVIDRDLWRAGSTCSVTFRHIPGAEIPRIDAHGVNTKSLKCAGYARSLKCTWIGDVDTGPKNGLRRLMGMDISNACGIRARIVNFVA